MDEMELDERKIKILDADGNIWSVERAMGFLHGHWALPGKICFQIRSFRKMRHR